MRREEVYRVCMEMVQRFNSEDWPDWKWPTVTTSGTTSELVVNMGTTASTTWSWTYRDYAANAVRLIYQLQNEETQEQRAARQESERKHRAARRAAESRAEELLRQYLTQDQQRELDEKRYFTLRSSSGRTYRIYRGRSGNVRMLDPVSQQEVKKFCIHPIISCPDADTMLAQKVMLETDEPSFWKTANITELRQKQVPLYVEGDPPRFVWEAA